MAGLKMTSRRKHSTMSALKPTGLAVQFAVGIVAQSIPENCHPIAMCFVAGLVATH